MRCTLSIRIRSSLLLDGSFNQTDLGANGYHEHCEHKQYKEYEKPGGQEGFAALVTPGLGLTFIFRTNSR